MNGPHTLVQEFRDARQGKRAVVLEGFHAIKHAFRFGANVTHLVSSSPSYVEQLVASNAPRMESTFSKLEVVDEKIFEQLSPNPPESKIIALADRPDYTLEKVLSVPQSNPIVLLDNPSHPGNVGSAIRVAAAAGAHAVFVTGNLDPWRPQVLRGAQGLHFALPVLHIENITELDRPFIVFDERGGNFADTKIPHDAIFVFGSERRGVSEEIKERAEKIVSIPMRENVSSINLATAVGIALYGTKM